MTASGQTFQVRNTFTLSQSGSFTRVKTKITNTSATPLNNVRYWVGTRDDWVGTADNPAKTKGIIQSGSFNPITVQSTPSDALKIESAGTVVYFFTTYNQPRVNTIINGYGTFGPNVVAFDPTFSAMYIPSQDSAYGIFLRLNDLAPGASDEFTWYYAA
jgi:large repetitive protein